MEEEERVLEAIAAGDADAYGRWLAGAERPVRVTLRPFAAWVDAEAVLQEAFLRVWQVAPRLKHDGIPNALLRFAVTTARNVALSELRRSTPEVTDVATLERELAKQGAVQPVTPDPHLRALIEECRRKLPLKPAQALSERLASGGCHDDSALAARLGMSLNTFLQNFTRARKALMACLARAGVDLDAELSP